MFGRTDLDTYILLCNKCIYRKSLYYIYIYIISMYTRHELLSHAQPLCWTAGSHELLLVYLRIYHVFFSSEVPSWDLGQWINISLTKGNAMPPGSGVCHFVFWLWNYVALMQAIFARPFNKRSVPAPSAGCQAWDCGEPECSKSCKAARGLSVFSLHRARHCLDQKRVSLTLHCSCGRCRVLNTVPHFSPAKIPFCLGGTIVFATEKSDLKSSQMRKGKDPHRPTLKSFATRWVLQEMPRLCPWICLACARVAACLPSLIPPGPQAPP